MAPHKNNADSSDLESDGGSSPSSRSGSPASQHGSSGGSTPRRSGSDASQKSGSRSPSGSPKSHKSGSNRSRSGSPQSGRSRSGSPQSDRSRSGSRKSGRSRSGSRKSGSGSPHSNRSRSGTPGSGKSRSGSPQSGRSRSGSRKSGSGSPQSHRSGSGSPQSRRSGSGSPKSARSRSGSPQSGRSRTGSPKSVRSGSAKSGSRSRSGSARSGRSKSGSAKSGSRSRSGSVKSRSRSPSGSRKSARSGSAKSGSRSRSVSPKSGKSGSVKSGKSKSPGKGSDSDTPTQKRKRAVISDDSNSDAENNKRQDGKPATAEALFGDAGDISSEEEQGGGKEVDKDKVSDMDQDEEGLKDFIEPDEEKAEEEEEPIPETLIEVEIPRINTDLGRELHFVKLPNFLSVDTRPFDPNTYEDEIDEEETLDEEGRARLKLKVENTMRWREEFNENGEAVKESNTRIVKWSDGSMSLHLGSEIFDVYKQPLQGDHNHLFVRQGTGLQGQAVFRTKLTFRPHSTESFTHRKMTLSLADRSQKISGIKVISQVGMDPDAHREEMIKKEEERLRASLRRENKQRRIRERGATRGLSASYLEPDYDGSDDENAISLAAIKNKYKKGGAASREPRAPIYSSDEDDDDDSDFEARRTRTSDRKQAKALKVSDEEDEDQGEQASDAEDSD